MIEGDRHIFRATSFRRECKRDDRMVREAADFLAGLIAHRQITRLVTRHLATLPPADDFAGYSAAE